MDWILPQAILILLILLRNQNLIEEAVLIDRYRQALHLLILMIHWIAACY